MCLRSAVFLAPGSSSRARGESALPQVPCEAEVAVRTLTPEDCRSARDRGILPESLFLSAREVR